MTQECIMYKRELPFRLQNVFTVSVGNLPPTASVLIRITYVAELRVDCGIVTFSVPGSVAPWEVEPNLDQVTQVSTYSHFRIFRGIKLTFL